MLDLQLDFNEREILADILLAVLAELRMEIGRTDRKDYREVLKERKRVLRKVLAALGEMEESPMERAGLSRGG